MPDITKGKTFVSGETVTAQELNSIVDDATINNLVIDNAKLAANAVDNSKVSVTAGIDYTKLATLPGGNLLVGNEDNQAASVALSGDITISDTGVSAIGNDKVTAAMMADNSVDGSMISVGDDAQGDILYFDGTNYVRLGAGTDGQILKTQGAEANPVWSGALDPAPSMTIYSASGSHTWTKPTGVTLIQVLVTGGGGGGSDGAGGGAGGHGGTASDWIDVSAVSTVSITVGAGGVVVSSEGQSGSSSTFGSYMTGAGGSGSLGIGGLDGTSGTGSGSQGTCINISDGNSSYGLGGSGPPGATGTDGAVAVRVIG